MIDLKPRAMKLFSGRACGGTAVAGVIVVGVATAAAVAAADAATPTTGNVFSLVTHKYTNTT